MVNSKKVEIFTTEQQNPCGAGSSCCGPVGQTEQEIAALKNAVEQLGVEVEVYDVQKMKNLREKQEVFKLLNIYGANAIPVITVNNEITSVGKAEINDVISKIKSKL